jgi:hypothetical protein
MSIVLCRDCIHWTATNNYPDCPRDLPATKGYWTGECSRIQDAIDIEISAGWEGGVVRCVETDANFGCVLGIMKA